MKPRTLISLESSLSLEECLRAWMQEHLFCLCICWQAAFSTYENLVSAMCANSWNKYVLRLTAWGAEKSEIATIKELYQRLFCWSELEVNWRTQLMNCINMSLYTIFSYKRIWVCVPLWNIMNNSTMENKNFFPTVLMLLVSFPKSSSVIAKFKKQNRNIYTDLF